MDISNSYNDKIINKICLMLKTCNNGHIIKLKINETIFLNISAVMV